MINKIFTTSIKEKNEEVILKAKIMSDRVIYFQIFNKTRGVVSKGYELSPSYGMLRTGENKKSVELMTSTKNFNRNRMVGIYNTLMLRNMIDFYKKEKTDDGKEQTEK